MRTSSRAAAALLAAPATVPELECPVRGAKRAARPSRRRLQRPRRAGAAVATVVIAVTTAGPKAKAKRRSRRRRSRRPQPPPLPTSRHRRRRAARDDDDDAASSGGVVGQPLPFGGVRAAAEGGGDELRVADGERPRRRRQRQRRGGSKRASALPLRPLAPPRRCGLEHDGEAALHTAWSSAQRDLGASSRTDATRRVYEPSRIVLPTATRGSSWCSARRLTLPSPPSSPRRWRPSRMGEGGAARRANLSPFSPRRSCRRRPRRRRTTTRRTRRRRRLRAVDGDAAAGAAGPPPQVTLSMLLRGGGRSRSALPSRPGSASP